MKLIMENWKKFVNEADYRSPQGGGAPGDGTTILAKLIDQSARKAVVVLCDPEAVRGAKALGAGAMFSGNVGGKSDDLHGPPMPDRKSVV